MSECRDCAADLHQVLIEERSALESRDSGALESTTAEKKHHLNRLEQLDSKRGDLSAKYGFGMQMADMPELIAWCDQDQAIAKNWLGFVEIAKDCGSLNMTNGSIIQMRRQQIKQSLSVLRSGSDDRETYGSNGEETSTMGPRTLAEI